MSSSEPPHYLHPDFDASKLKMDDLRTILIQHHVKTPTGLVRKRQLIDLFNQHIRPQIPELSQAEKDIDNSDREDKPAKPTSKARQSRVKVSTEDEEGQPDSAPVKVARVKRASSRSRLAQEDPVEIKPKLKRSNSRAKASVDKSDTESKMAEPARGRKTRKEVAQSEDESEPIVKPVRKTTKKKTKSDNFSNENPFQSGSESERKRSRSRSRTRKAERAPASDNVFKVPAQPAFSKFMHTAQTDKMEPNSHSTATKTPTHTKPRKLSTDGQPAPKPLHLSTKATDIQEFVKTLRRNVAPISIMFSAILLAYAIWLRQTRIEIGFCTETDLETPPSRPWYYPTCIPCPDHAICLRSDAEPICPPEYILKPQILSFGNLFPITPVCVLNKAKEYRSLQVADAVETLLHLHAGNVECSLLRDRAPKNSLEYRTHRSLSTEELRYQLEQLKDTNVSDEDFSQYWDLAIKELHRRSDKVVFEQGLARQVEERIRSLKPKKSLGCRLRQALVGWIVRFKLFLFAVFSSIAGGFAIRAQVVRRRKEGRVVNGLVQNVLSKLSDQAHYFYVDPVIYPEPFLPQTHLRDALLADVHSPARRQEIWNKVQAVVERNSNVRTDTQEVRGELHRVWEWVGASGVLGQQHGGAAAGEGSHSQGHSHSHGYSHAHDYPQVEISGSTRARSTPKVPPRTGPHGSFFGMRREDSEYLNPENPLYPSLPRD
ncbi:inner nuclear membrane protein enriched at telomere/subtelomere region [Mortierella claussenii]|nr:inner nuclear membrane protein enriched at telomere/subtelomere region [Mortierella claussenii]